MSQPQFSDGPPVPLLTEGTIDTATLRQLGADLGRAAEVLNVREKSAATAYAEAGELALEDALERLTNGVARAVQIRYRYDGFEWTDTILAVPAGFRVIRCRHET